MRDSENTIAAHAPTLSNAGEHKILAIASAGGHWQQLMMLRPAFNGHEMHFVTTLPGLAQEFDAIPSTLVPDCNRNRKIQMARSLVAIFRVMRRVRPTVVISTGALPGVIALALGRYYGAKTIWVDSVANAEEMSMSGQMAQRFADLWLTQWEDVAGQAGAEYSGAVL